MLWERYGGRSSCDLAIVRLTGSPAGEVPSILAFSFMFWVYIHSLYACAAHGIVIRDPRTSVVALYVWSVA